MTHRAVTAGDLAHYRLPLMKKRVGQAMDVLEAAMRRGRTGVSYSGGKDSTALLSLARVLDTDIPAAFYDSGSDFPETRDLVHVSGVEVITPQKSLPEMLRAGGYWGYDGPLREENSPRFDFRAFLINEPSRQFITRHRLSVVCLGLRMQESAGRRMRGKTVAKSPVQSVQGQDCCHAYPLMAWTHDDIWAYIAGRGLPYHPVYDRMAQIGIPRAECRVGTLLGTGGIDHGRFARMRVLYPALFNELAAEFPEIVHFT